MTGRKVLKIIVISVIATLFRSVIQLLIPATSQSVLQQSIFVKNGTLPIVFMIYATATYAAITVIFILISRGVGGRKISKGLKIGLIYAIVWAVFLLEPLPQASIIDLISYPLADGSALILLGLMSGKFLFNDSQNSNHNLSNNSIFNIIIITSFFLIGRIFQYKVFHIYSMFEQAPVKTLFWIICTGIVIGFMFQYLNYTINIKNSFTKSLIFGGFFFGINLLFFNFFMPLVLNVDILDLFIRTFIDIISIFIGSLIINIKESRSE